MRHDDFRDATPAKPCPCSAAALAKTFGVVVDVGTIKVCNRCERSWILHAAIDYGHDVMPGDPPSRPYWTVSYRRGGQP